MSFEPGGHAEKLGNRFEGRWVVRQLLRLAFEEVHSVTIECIGDDERGVDLWLERKDGIRQAQQCKARNAGREHWSVSDLRVRGILAYMKLQLDRDPSHEFGLVSGLSATQIADICQSARDSNGKGDGFYRHQIEAIGQNRRTVFRDFCVALELDVQSPDDRERAFDYLRRIHFHAFHDDQNTRDELRTWAGMLFSGDPDAAIALLADFAEGELRKPIHADQVRNRLNALGFHPKQLAHDKRIAPILSERRREFVEWLRPKLIRGQLIHREASQQIRELVEKDGVVVVHGAAGTGKSGVLLELAQELDRDGVVCLPISLDQWFPKNTTREFGEDLGLPDSPAFCLDALAGIRPSVLIVDQLDALRWTAAHSPNALAVCRALVREVRALRFRGRQIGIVFSCRTFDLEHDPALSNWLGNPSQGQCHKIEVKGLSEEIVGQLVGSFYATMSIQQKRVLASPHNLAMWVQVAAVHDVPTFQSATGLMRAFWDDRFRELQNVGISNTEVRSTLDTIVDHMDRKRERKAPVRLLADCPRVADALHSLGVFYTVSHSIAFSHQSYLDFLVADRQLRRIYQGASLFDWLGQKDTQSLFIREQLRYMLSLLCDESPNHFLQEVSHVLAAPSVRFHLKHLVLEILSQIESPSPELMNYLVQLINEGPLQLHVQETVFCARKQFVLALVDRGIIREWLASQQVELVNTALWLLRSINEQCGDTMAILLEPYLTQGEEWCKRILWTLPIGTRGDSEKVFALRLQLARVGLADDLVDWKSLARESPCRAIQLVEAVLSAYNPSGDGNGRGSTKPVRGQQSRLEDWLTDDVEALAEAASRHPLNTWDMLMPHIMRLIPTSLDESRYSWFEWEETESAADKGPTRDILIGVVQMVRAAGRCLAGQQPDELLQRSRPLENSESQIVQHILVDVYASLPAEYADGALKWLLADTRRLNIGLGRCEPEWSPAAKMIKCLSPHCSIAVFDDLEQTILRYHCPDEKRLAEYFLQESRHGRVRYWFGEAQHFLLPALCQSRRSVETEGMIGVLERKFGQLNKSDYWGGGHSSGGCITSPLKPEKLLKISDRAWLEIVQNKNIVPDHRSMRWKQVGPDHATESSVEEFSRSLADAAKRDPERFARLALKFPKGVPSAYTAAVLHGIHFATPTDVPNEEKASWAPAQHDTIEALFDSLGLSDDRDAAYSYCWLLRNRAKEEWSERAISRLVHYAEDHPDPAIGELNVHGGHRGDSCDNASVAHLMDNVLNSVRSAAGLAIGALLWEHPEWLDRLRSGIESLIQDPHPVPRMAAVSACLSALRVDKDLAVSWFCAACQDDLRIAACEWSREIFNLAIRCHYEQLAPIVFAMCRSDRDDVAQEGAEEVAARWLFSGMFEQELAACRQGSDANRRGVAHVAASFLPKDMYTERCREILLSFFDDSDPKVRSEATRLFTRNDVLRLPKMADYVNRFIRSTAFTDDPTWLLMAYDRYPDSLIPHADSLLAICEVLSGPLAEHTRGVDTRLGHDVTYIPPLLLRLYEQAQDQEMSDVQNKCLDAWDLLFEHRVGTTRDLMKALDR